jgi:lipopolysaccharide heptosyltransferase II
MKIAFIKFIDTCLGRLVSVIPRSKQITQVIIPSSILIIRPGGIGDAVLLAPVINYLKKFLPAVHITILAENRNASIFRLVPGVDEVFCYDHPLDFLYVIWNHYDVVIDTEQWHRLSAVVARLVRTPVKIGFDTNERRRMFTNAISYSHDDSEMVSFAHLLAPLVVEGAAVEVGTPFLYIPNASFVKASKFIELLQKEPIVTIFPGASISERRWGADRFRRLAEMLSAFGLRIVVVGGKQDRQQGEVIIGGGLGLNLAGLTSLSETAAVIQKSSLLISGDSGVLHIAVGLGVPTVSLFGPGMVKKWAPQGDNHIVINKGLSCSPCTVFGNTPPCPINAKCMSDITVDEVVNAVTMLLTSLGSMPSRCCKRDWIEMP